jgi:regulatory protein
MIDVQEFLASHPVAFADPTDGWCGDDGFASLDGTGRSGEADEDCDNRDDVVSGRGTQAKRSSSVDRQSRRSRYEARTHTHTVPVASSYTSGFGVAMQEDDDPQTEVSEGNTYDGVEPDFHKTTRQGINGGSSEGERRKAESRYGFGQAGTNEVGGSAQTVASKTSAGFGSVGAAAFTDDTDGYGRSSFSKRNKGFRRGRRRANRYRAYPQGGPVRRVPDDPTDAQACQEAALTLLDASAKSSSALIKRLVDKGYDETVSQDVVAHLAQLHLVDDQEFAQGVVRSCVARMMGERGTMMELQRKGVETSLAKTVAAQARDQGLFEDAAWELGRSVAAKTKGLETQVRLRRFWSAGGRKGHDPSVLREVAQQLFSTSAD